MQPSTPLSLITHLCPLLPTNIPHQNQNDNRNCFFTYSKHIKSNFFFIRFDFRLWQNNCFFFDIFDIGVIFHNTVVLVFYHFWFFSQKKMVHEKIFDFPFPGLIPLFLNCKFCSLILDFNKGLSFL